ncbi:MAG: Ig-like domain-containing protein [Archangium sp.]
MNHSFRSSLLLSAALFAACPSPEPVADGGELTDSGSTMVDAGGVPTAKLELLSPETGTVSFVPETTLEVKVRDAAADSIRVTVNALPPVSLAGPIAAGETRSTMLTLEVGVNRIHVELLVDGEVVAEETPVFFVQESPVPLLDVMTPAQNEVTLRASIDVAGRIVSSRPITTATVKVGADAATTLTLTPAPGGFLFTGTAALTLGSNSVVFSVIDDRNESASETRTVTRDADAVNPMVSITWPRAGQAVRVRNPVIRGTANDNAGISEVELSFGTQDVVATVNTDGTWEAVMPSELVPGLNDFAVTARDQSGNEAHANSQLYYGMRLASGGAHGFVIVGDGGVYGFGRNNLGQTGLNFVSHENRTAFCDRGVTGTSNSTICKATSVTLLDGLCNNPNFVTPVPDAGSAEPVACRAEVRLRRDELCTASGAAAGSTCFTSATANLMTLCDTTYGVGTPTNTACKAGLVCNSVYPGTSAENANCKAVLASIPNTYPAPATPSTPTYVAGLTTAARLVTANQNASAALDENGDIWSWGDNASGQLGLGDTTQRNVPTRVPPFVTPPAKVVALHRGYDNLMALDSTGKVWACGLNSLGQVGDGTSGAANNRTSFVAVVGLPANIVQVSAAAATSYALAADGTVWAWGRNEYGNLGNGITNTTANATPAQVPGLTDVTMIATGRDHVLALKRDGTVWAWGLNASKQVNGGTSPVTSPAMIMGIVDARGVYANGTQSFYEDTQGRLWGWGANGNGNLGIPEEENQPTPSSPVFGVSAVNDVGIGSLQGFAMRGTQVFAWGWSFHGSLGAGDSAIHTWGYRTPVLVALP